MSTAFARKLDSIREKSGVTSREVAQLLATTPQTISRWQTGQSSPQPKSMGRLLWLDWLAEQLSQFYEPDEARLWLFSHHKDLHGERPVDLIVEDRIDAVMALIDQLQSGAYS
jgi:transcriptional regulator with XRE-family HTH domain